MPTSYPFLGVTDHAPAIVRAVLKSWTHPLGAAPGPALIELNLGTAAGRTGLCARARSCGHLAALAVLLSGQAGHRAGGVAAWLS